MRFEIKLRIVADDGAVIEDREILALDKANDRIESVGLSLGEAKSLLGRLQQQLVEAQAASFVAGQRCCPDCGRRRRRKGRYPITFRTAFGNVAIASPRFHHCGCQPANSKTFSPGYVNEPWPTLLTKVGPPNGALFMPGFGCRRGFF